MRLRQGAAALLALMPIFMALAHRSAPLVLSLAAVLAVAAAAVEASLPTVWAEAKALLATPLGLAVVAFVAYAALTIAWSPAPIASAFTWLEFVWPALAALLLALALPARAPRFAIPLLIFATAAACLLILGELWTDVAIRRSLGMRWYGLIFNRPALLLLVLAPPLLWALAQRRRHWLALVVAALVGIIIIRSESGAATLGLFVGLATFAVARWSRRAALTGAVAGFIVTFAIAPITGELLHKTLPSALHQHLLASNSQARVDIWRSFGLAVRAEPWLGAGLAPGAAFVQTEAALRVEPSYRTFLGVGHAHNGALQIWAELGAAGAFLALVALLLVVRSLSVGPPADLAPRLALLAAAASASLVGHGLWQGWWAASIGAAIVWFRIADQHGKESA